MTAGANDAGVTGTTFGQMKTRSGQGDVREAVSNAALSSVNFNIIRYANCWEDAGMLLQVFATKPPRDIAIVASAGDNALACLAAHPASVLAFDISKPQLYLTELKQQAYAFLERDELLAFLGIGDAPAAARLRLLEHLNPHLSKGCREYWNRHRQVVSNGIIHGGKFEAYFRIFRKYCLPLVHSRKTILALFNLKSPDELQEFYHRRWNNLRWRLLMRLFFSRYFMGRAGRDPQFLKHVEVPVADYIRRRTEEHLQSPIAMRNHFLQYVFTGSFSTLLPHYLRPELHEAIRANIGRLSLRQASAEDIVQLRSHDAYCLSNIFEYYSMDDFEATAGRWKDALAPGASLLFWNLMVPRSFALIASDSFRAAGTLDPGSDAGFFYSAFRNEQRR